VYIDDWTTEATRSLWYAIQEENPRIFPKILWTDHPTLSEAVERFKDWVEKKKIKLLSNYDDKFELEREMISSALEDVDWYVLTHRIALALNIPVREIPHSLVCDKCQQLICQLCVACINPLCENAHQIDCLSESKIYPLGPLLFDFTDRKLVVRLGDYELPIPPDELRRFYIWLDIRKDWC
jgi:hypothetical protein